MSAARVVFVSSHAQLGGAERYLLLLLERLGPDWVEEVVTLEDGPFVERLRAAGQPTQVVATGRGPGDVLGAARKLRALLRRSRAEVVHANGIKAAVVCGLATLGCRLPVVWVKHDFSGDGLPARLVGASVEQVVGVSNAVVETFGRRNAKVHVVYNGLPERDVDRDRGRTLLAELVSPREPSAVVALVGRLDPDKGHAELIAVLPELTKRVPGLQAVFVGAENPARPEYVRALRQSLAEAGLDDAVSFLGYRDDALEIVAGSDVVVIPSVRNERGHGREGFGLVGVEALSAGTPVVGYADGALEEILGDCALLVPAGDREALAQALLRALTDADARARLVDCGRSRVRDRFSFDAVAAGMRERYAAARQRDYAHGR